jgi:hypothetical protein
MVLVRDTHGDPAMPDYVASWGLEACVGLCNLLTRSIDAT